MPATSAGELFTVEEALPVPVDAGFLRRGRGAAGDFAQSPKAESQWNSSLGRVRSPAVRQTFCSKHRQTVFHYSQHLETCVGSRKWASQIESRGSSGRRARVAEASTDSTTAIHRYRLTRSRGRRWCRATIVCCRQTVLFAPEFTADLIYNQCGGA